MTNDTHGPPGPNPEPGPDHGASSPDSSTHDPATQDGTAQRGGLPPAVQALADLLGAAPTVAADGTVHLTGAPLEPRERPEVSPERAEEIRRIVDTGIAAGQARARRRSELGLKVGEYLDDRRDEPAGAASTDPGAEPGDAPPPAAGPRAGEPGDKVISLADYGAKRRHHRKDL